MWFLATLILLRIAYYFIGVENWPIKVLTSSFASSCAFFCGYWLARIDKAE